MSDYYNILGINKNATEMEIKKAYKKMAVKWHPDKNLDNKKQAEQKFKEISEAYQVLSNAEKEKYMIDMEKKDFKVMAGLMEVIFMQILILMKYLAPCLVICLVNNSEVEGGTEGFANNLNIEKKLIKQ